MGQILHGSATTTHAVRAAIQRSQAAIKELAAQYGLDPKTVAKWKKRAFVHDAAMRPKQVRSSVLTQDEEANLSAGDRVQLLVLPSNATKVFEGKGSFAYEPRGGSRGVKGKKTEETEPEK
jgi:transposase-like protein